VSTDLYTLFLTIMTLLFAASSGLLLFMTILQALRRGGRRAGVYFGLTLLAGVVAFAFYIVRRILG